MIYRIMDDYTNNASKNQKEFVPPNEVVEYNLNTLSITLEKEFVMKVKMICLNKMGFDIMTNVKFMKSSEKKRLIQNIEDMMKDVSRTQIENDFNNLVCETILSQDAKYTNYPIYHNQDRHNIVVSDESKSS